jgi:ABC-2 type transport system ATP-binding protein
MVQQTISRPAISIKNVSKTFKTYERGGGLLEAFKSLIKRKAKYKKALSKVSLEVKEGEILGLIGPNGAGKSTLIKAICGVLLLDSGKIQCLSLDPWKDRVKYVRDIGVVFGSKPLLWWDLPAIDSFYLMRDIYELPKEEFEERLQKFIKLLSIEDVSKQPVRDLSLGERMKCNLVVALLHKPKLVLLDEPTIGIDIVAKDRVREFIRDVNRKEKTTFIITTHDMSDIEKLCKRIAIINHGEIIYDGPLERVKKKYAKKKTIRATFESKIPKINLAGCSVRPKSEYEAEIEVDLGRQDIELVVHYLITKFRLVDITISDPPIEDIIKTIYKE